MSAEQVLNATSGSGTDEPSLVMNEMNSLTHSCMHSLASFAILALSGNAVFMIRATGAKLRMLASDSCLTCLEPRCGDCDCGDWLVMMCAFTGYSEAGHRNLNKRNAGADRSLK